MKKKNTTAMCAFSADPMTYGHTNIVERASKIFDKIIVGIGINPDKTYKFNILERVEMAKRSLLHLDNVEVVSFSGLLVDYAYEMGVDVIVKGVRNAHDFDYENVLYQIGESQRRGIETNILLSKPELSHISSSAVKEIHKSQGAIDNYVPLFVKQCLEEKSGQYLIGITGEIGVGKSYIAKRFIELGKKKGIKVYNLDLDSIGHQILGDLKEPAYERVRNHIANTFGDHVQNSDGSINRQILGEIVFNDSCKLNILNNIMQRPLAVRIQRELSCKKGLILFNAALIVESNMSYLSNNNVVLVSASKEIQSSRLCDRGMKEEQIETRLKTQLNFEKKDEYLKKIIQEKNQGKIWNLDNSIIESESVKNNNIEDLFIKILLKFKLLK